MSYHAPSVKDEALRLRKEAGVFGVIPVPVVKIAKSLDVEVIGTRQYPNAAKDGHTQIFENIPHIIFNEQKIPERSRFTIAHELGHVIFDKDYIKTHGSIDRDGVASDETYRQREVKANAFAAELLMPEEEFVDFFIKGGTIEEAAEYFFVSLMAAAIRATNLGLVRAN
jgi:Zn-dependent peptidase ImmA (M78 family)